MPGQPGKDDNRTMIFSKNSLTYPLLGILMLALVQTGCHRPETTPDVEVTFPFEGVDSAQLEAVLEDLSLDEKIGQLIVWETSLPDSLQKATAIQQVANGTVGGFLMENLPFTDFMYLSDSLKRSAKLPLFLGTREKVSLHNQFSYLPRFPLPASLASIDSAGLHRLLERHYLRQCKALGINFALGPTLKTDDPEQPAFDFQTFEDDETTLQARSERMVKRLEKNRILAIGDSFSEFQFVRTDSIRDSLLHRFLSFTRAGLPGLVVDDKAFQADTLRVTPAHFVKNYLKKYLDFNGLMVTQLAPGESPEQKLLEGTDLFITPDAGSTFEAISKLVASDKISLQDLDRRVRLVLKAKAWVNGGRLPVELTVFPVDSVQQQVRLVSLAEKRSPRIYSQPMPRPANFSDQVEEILCYFEDPGWGYFIGNLFENSVILARDDEQRLPFKSIYSTDFQLLAYSGQPFRTFEGFFSKYADFQKTDFKTPPSGELTPVNLTQAGESTAAVILLDNMDLLPGFHRAFIESVNALGERSKVVLVNFGNPKNLRFFSKNISCIQVFERNGWTEGYTAQLLFGGVPAVGRLPLTVGENLLFGAAVHTPVLRLAFSPSEKTGIAPERLVGINAIAETAIDKGVFPGCQVAVAKDGQVIYSQAFGQHSYGKKQREVRTTDLYDIASVTKIAATTLAVMKLAESQKIDLKGHVGDYLRLSNNAAIRNISVKDLLLHSSGLQAQMPIGKFYSHRNVPARGCNSIYCRTRRGAYSIKIADGLYLRKDYPDTIWSRVFKLPAYSKKQFRYSDVNFFLLQKIVETQSKTTLDDFVSENIYHPLGLRRILFNPMEKFGRDEIVPTEKDNYWRKTLVHGNVHDPAAALMGGVGGNSGVFANAEDLAALFQMLLNDGTYGGIQFFEPGTIHDFTITKNVNHRGLGFDKPANRRYPTYSRSSSPDSYGHTGFTGTCIWVDPEQKLVYVFLSNRINPSARNGKIFTEETRRRIHEVVYDALGTFEAKLPELAAGQGPMIEEEGD